MLRLPAAATTCVLLAVAACAGPRTDVKTEASPTADFRAYKTFAFLPAERLDMAGSRMLDPVTRHNLEAAIGRALQAKGLAPATTEPPGLLVGYFADVYEGPDEKRPISPQSGGMNYERQGKLSVDLVDAATQQVVWHGDAWARDPSRQLGEDVVADLMGRYPR